MTEAELLAMLESPKYVAVTSAEPTGSDEMASFASPPLSWAFPNTVFPAVKVTGPVAITVGDEILAVKVSAWPCVDGFGDDVSVAVLVASDTTWLSRAEVLPRLLASPVCCRQRVEIGVEVGSGQGGYAAAVERGRADGEATPCEVYFSRRRD